MGKRTLLNLALLVLLGALVLIAVYEPGKTPQLKPAPLTTLDPARIDRIRIDQPHGPTIALRREQGQWLLTAPLHARANSGRIQALLHLLDTPVHARFALGQHDPASYGLAPPRATVHFNNTVLAFGGSEPISHQRYVRAGKDIALITDSMTYYLLARPTAFVDLAVLAPQAEPVAFSLPGLTLHKTDGHWRATPATALRSADQITALVDAWRNSQALEVRPYKPAENAGTKVDSNTVKSISVHLAGVSQPLRFDVLDTRDGVLLARRDLGLAWLFPKAAAGHLLHLDAPPAEHPAASSHDPASTAANRS